MSESCMPYEWVNIQSAVEKAMKDIAGIPIQSNITLRPVYA